MIFMRNGTAISSSNITANITSSAIDITEALGFCAHAIWTGTPTGNVIIEASNNTTNWVAIDTTAMGGAAGQRLLNVAEVHYAYVRARYAYLAGSGTLTVYISSKTPSLK